MFLLVLSREGEIQAGIWTFKVHRVAVQEGGRLQSRGMYAQVQEVRPNVLHTASTALLVGVMVSTTFY